MCRAGHVRLCEAGSGTAGRPGGCRGLHGHPLPAGGSLRPRGPGRVGGLCLCAPGPVGGVGHDPSAAPGKPPGPRLCLRCADAHQPAGDATVDVDPGLLRRLPRPGAAQRPAAMAADVARIAAALAGPPGACPAAARRRLDPGPWLERLLCPAGHDREPLCPRGPVVRGSLCLGRRLCRVFPAILTQVGVWRQPARPRR